jgi:hypothetical protein
MFHFYGRNFISVVKLRRFILNTDTPEVQSQMVRTVHDAHVLSAWVSMLMIVLQFIIIL